MKNSFARIATLAVLILTSSSAFAQYSGDMQLVLGHDHQYITLADDNYGWKANTFDIGLKSFNTFEFLNFLGIGFLGSCDLTLGTNINTRKSASPDMDFLIGFDAFLGPAVTVKILDIIALQGALGFDWQYMAINGETEYSGFIKKTQDFTIYEKSIGFGFDIQAKLFPTAPVSAVFGIKGIFVESDEYKVDTDDDRYTVDNDFDVDSFKFYAGAALKF